MSETSPSHVGDVEQPIHSIEIDERAEVGQIFDRALHAIAHVDTLEKLLPFLAAFLLDQFTATQDDVTTVVVDLDDFEIVSVPDKLLQIFRWNDVDLRGGQKYLDANVYH